MHMKGRARSILPCNAYTSCRLIKLVLSHDNEYVHMNMCWVL